ncbi:MAG: hypothetical protein JXP34_21485 [Planctomycetes bacterium]|nr:hypothetical protein [Planctomycetota bacterium]
MRSRVAGAVLPVAAAVLAAASPAQAATWQYRVPFEIAGRASKEGASGRGSAFLWLPPACERIRAALVGGKLGIEIELALDPAVREACAENDIAIVYFVPHIAAVFHDWEEGNSDAARFLAAFDALARRSGHPELARVPWITMGHSTAGIFSRNVAYKWPERVAGILHIKSGNIHQKEHLPPSGSLAGVPILAMNGQFETFGPEGGIRPEFGRETQWVFVRKDFQRLLEKDPRHLPSLWIDPGGDHFHGSPELAAYAALFIRKTAKYRIPAAPPPGDSEPVCCLPVKPADGWLTDADLYRPAHPPAPYATFEGDRARAMWHYDGEIARATARHHATLGAHQCLSIPALTWLDEGDGWTFRASAGFLDVLPIAYGGGVGGKPCGRAAGPILFRAKPGEPVERVGPGTFRVVRPASSVAIAAVQPGDARIRATNRWGTLKIPAVRGRSQAIEFPGIADLCARGGSAKLEARASSGLPVSYEVQYGPVIIRDGRVQVWEVPAGARFPIECRVTAYQMGRRIAPEIAPAAPVSIEFHVVGGPERRPALPAPHPSEDTG